MEAASILVYYLAFDSLSPPFLSFHLGVEDDGIIKGIEASPSEREQILQGFEAIVNRFRPHVDPSLYQITFLPVIPKNGCMDIFSVIFTQTLCHHFLSN